MLKLSVTIITLNEEKHIRKCIESVISIADEIIVVDSGSTDKTVEIARKLGANVYYRKFDNYGNQKNYASEKVKYDWILSIDADETLEENLIIEIKKAVENNDCEAYSIPRKNIIFGKFIRYTRWQPELDRHVWLYKKDKGKWVNEVHEEVQVVGRIGRLKNAKVHYQYETITEFLVMMNNYSSIEARENFKNGKSFSVISLLFAPLYNFMVRYFYRLGFLDGWRGFALSYLMAIYHVEVVVKIWELHKKNV
jgi:glycosyltransferase involved in cell wall biosynthesis